MNYRAGFVGLVGQPNAGKSTLMNWLVREKVSIVSSKPQTTRRRVLGLYSCDRGQAVFVDSPGLLHAQKGLNAFLEHEANDIIKESDILVAVLPLDEKSPEIVEATMSHIVKAQKPWLAVLSKADLRDKQHRAPIIRSMVERAGANAWSLSALEDSSRALEDRNLFLEAVIGMLPEATRPLYDVELFTPEPLRFLAAEIVREKCFENLHNEVPFSLAVRVIKFDESRPVPHLVFDILVGKENHKAIVIGESGKMIKKISMSSRQEIEKLMGQRIFLELKVSYRENWTNNRRIMQELGYECKVN
ncbi:MAG: GTPase Era [Bdellovibrionaceae bacterium]|nr:GTPase Era [Pseudobdellovibrionaceae bacterium]